MLEEYRKHVAERAAEGLRPNHGCKPKAALVELLKTRPRAKKNSC